MIICIFSVLFSTDRRIYAEANQTILIVDDDGPADFNSIQEAINNASSGATIFVRVGTYNENIVINKTVALIGEDRDRTIIDGSGARNVIGIFWASNATVKNFTIKGSTGPLYDGIALNHALGCVVSNNRVTDSVDGISLSRSNDNVISGNNISRNNEGIYLSSASGNTFSDNIVYSNKYDGIYLSSSSGNTFSRNVVSYNALDGISLYDSSGNVFKGNTILGSNYGISALFPSANNTVYHNNFNNTVQVWVESTQIWNYSGAGNYWSNYAELDLNKDGIGDIPYIINADNQDHYPLMGTFSSFDVTVETKTCDVNIISNSTISNFRFQIGNETGNKIVSFKAETKKGFAGFSRVTLPLELMEGPYIVLVGAREVVPTRLNISDPTKASLYFAYSDGNLTIFVVSSRTLHLYSELLLRYYDLQASLSTLNATYYDLLANYVMLQQDLQKLNASLASLSTLNATYYDLLTDFDELQKDLNNLGELQTSFYALNQTNRDLITSYNKLLGNYSDLLERFASMDASYQQHITQYSEQMQNFRNLIYVFAAATAIFIATTLYLSKLHAETRRRNSGAF
jgi:parallel beta-helix repeat protein